MEDEILKLLKSLNSDIVSDHSIIEKMSNSELNELLTEYQYLKTVNEAMLKSTTKMVKRVESEKVNRRLDKISQINKQISFIEELIHDRDKNL